MGKWKFLCICHYGHSRSVALCRVLHEKGFQAVAAGLYTGSDSFGVLSEWADKILIMVDRVVIPEQHRGKIIDFNIGPDIWSNPYNQELLTLLTKKVETDLGIH